MKDSKKTAGGLPQALSSLVSGVAAVVSLYAAIYLSKAVGITPKDYSLPGKFWILFFAVFAVGDAVVAAFRKPRKRPRKYPK